MTAVDCVLAAANRLGESPVWCGRRRRLFWVDSRGPTVHWYDPATGGTSSVAVPELIGSIGLRERDHCFIAGLRSGIFLLDPDTGAVELVAAPEQERPENRFNDGRCDRQGRFWTGTMNDQIRNPTGSLYRLDPDHRCTWIQGDIVVPNSLAWSPDSRVMYFADTYRHRIMAYTFDADAGLPRAERVFVDLADQPGRPDGSAVDADGCLWNAEYAGGRVVRYTPDGRVDRVIGVPVSSPTCCAFGGPDLEVLFVTSAAQRLTSGELSRQPLAGGLFAVVPGVKGLPEPRYRG